MYTKRFRPSYLALLNCIAAAAALWEPRRKIVRETCGQEVPILKEEADKAIHHVREEKTLSMPPYSNAAAQEYLSPWTLCKSTLAIIATCRGRVSSRLGGRSDGAARRTY
ncbi:hypothetical protein R3P38DRAFT_3009018 [Favolaschia claudopus]|uniref:Uncharacterized protein n=1 Tax=Favolaschia claudopus TaxID=2862362 RepID=A0AAW0AJ12_9AGAR